jgi:hypothetical protein
LCLVEEHRGDYTPPSALHQEPDSNKITGAFKQVVLLFEYQLNVKSINRQNYLPMNKNRFKNRKGRVALKHLSMMVKVFN